MNADKLLENLKYEARSFALWDKQIEANVLDAIIRSLQYSLDKEPINDYIGNDEDTPF